MVGSINELVSNIQTINGILDIVDMLLTLSVIAVAFTFSALVVKLAYKENIKKILVLFIISAFAFVSLLYSAIELTTAKHQYINDYIKNHNVDKCEIYKVLAKRIGGEWYKVYFNNCVK